MLAHEPEPLSFARARLPAALARLITEAELLAGTFPRPGLQRRHVFDFEDGLRLIVSREDHGSQRIGPRRGLGEVVHVSASLTAGSSELRRCQFARNPRKAFLLAAIARMAELLDRPYRESLFLWSESGYVPHWFLKIDQDPLCASASPRELLRCCLESPDWHNCPPEYTGGGDWCCWQAGERDEEIECPCPCHRERRGT